MALVPGVVVQRHVGLGHEPERAGKRMTQILAGIADDPQRIGSGVEVHAEEIALEIDGELGHLERLGGARVDRVDPAAVAEPVELPVLDPEIDADQRVVVALQAIHGPDLSLSSGPTLPERHEFLIGGEPEDGQPLGPGEVEALAAKRGLARFGR